jgi:hypothetical protein
VFEFADVPFNQIISSTISELVVTVSNTGYLIELRKLNDWNTFGALLNSYGVSDSDAFNPICLKLERSGTTIYASYSKNGRYFTDLPDDDEYDSPGEIGTNALSSSSQNRIYVFDEDNAARSTERIENFSVVELPLTHAIPLARRVLKKRKTRAARLQMEITGRDNTLTKGTPIHAGGRDGASLGNFLIEGRSMRGNNKERSMTITGRQI